MIQFILLQIAYIVSRQLHCFSTARGVLLDMIKGRVFDIKGACKHSGNCCQSIMLYDNAKPLQSLSAWKVWLAQHPEYYSFIPNHQSGRIASFDCCSLTSDHRCNRYESRPFICHHYPRSFFYEHGFIYDTCGYNVQKNQQNFNRLFSSIKDELNLFFQPNA